MIDPTKIPVSKPGEYPDLWHIVIKKVVPRPKGGANPSTHMGQTSLLIPVEEFDNIVDFLTWFSKVARAAEGTQEQAMKCDADMKSVELCVHDIPASRCEECCRVLQSGEGVEPEEFSSVPPLLPPEPASAPQPTPTSTPPPTPPQPEAAPPTDSDEMYESGIPFLDTKWCREMFFRAEEEVEADLSNRERSTMAYIIWKIRFEHIVVRMLVWWYWFNLYACSTFWWYDLVAVWFLGPLWWPWLLMRYMHWPPLRKIFVKYMGHRMYARIRTPQAVKVCAAIVGAVTVLKTSQWLYRLMHPEQQIYQCIVCFQEYDGAHPCKHKLTDNCRRCAKERTKPCWPCIKARIQRIEPIIECYLCDDDHPVSFKCKQKFSCYKTYYDSDDEYRSYFDADECPCDKCVAECEKHDCSKCKLKADC
jgi:hypothetical protein